MLNGIDRAANSAALSDLEETLRWKDNEVGTGAGGAGKAESFHDKLRRALGITA